MNGIILAGGYGTRLYPSTVQCSKQMLPVYDKPMIYYSLAAMLDLGIKKILIISQSSNILAMKRLIRGDGASDFGAEIHYAAQELPRGIAEALLIAAECGFCTDRDQCCLMLGDNIFHGASDELRMAKTNCSTGGDAIVTLYQTPEQCRYGVAVSKEKYSNSLHWVSKIVEKPRHSIRNGFAVPGVYFYPRDVYTKAASLKPSDRGELEITDLNNLYAEEDRLLGIRLPSHTAWMDAGTPGAMLQSSEYVRSHQERTGLPIGSPEYSAYVRGLISEEKFVQLVAEMPDSPYKSMLEGAIGISNVHNIA